MLRLTARRLRGLPAAAGPARLQASLSVAECIPSCSHHALVHTEAADKTAYSPRNSGRSPRREDSRPLDPDRHVAQAQYPSSRRRNDAYAAPRADYRPQRAQRGMPLSSLRCPFLIADAIPCIPWNLQNDPTTPTRLRCGKIRDGRENRVGGQVGHNTLLISRGMNTRRPLHPLKTVLSWRRRRRSKLHT